MEHTPKDPSQIKGWGVDADPKNDPTYPMKNRNNGEHAGYSWERPPQQPITIEVLHSNERPNVTSVFGTSTPPSGLSGVIRRIAFRYSESSYGHWLPLMLADRVSVVEGVLDRKSTRLNSSHANISYAVFCLKKNNHHPYYYTVMPITF